MTRGATIGALAALVAALFALSLIAGKVWVPLAAWAPGDPRWPIILELRLPRAVLGTALGAVLGLSGAVLQGYLRNPLADPAVVGVSSAAAFGAVAAILLGFAGGAGLFAFAMLAAAGAMALLVALTWRAESAVAFILAGTVLASLAGALTAFLISLAPNPYAVAEVIDWLMGALTDRTWSDLVYALPCMAAGAALLLLTGRSLDALTLGEAAARSIGVRLGRLQALVVIGTGLSVGAGVAVTGVVGFVGLVVPHLLRPIVGHRPSALLVPSALGGAALVLAADTLCRLAPGVGEVRLGVAMALIGAPFFLVLLLRGAPRMALTFDHLSVTLGGRAILRDVRAALLPGRITAILGPNGAGKSTLVKAACALVPFDGDIWLGEERVTTLDPRTRARAIGYLPQDATVHWNLAGREIVALGRLPHRAGTAADDAAIARALEATDTAIFADRAVNTLSGGERARVLLARVLAGEPRWILADEPLASLDPAHQFALLGLLRKEAACGVGIAIVLHDLALAARFADEAILLDRGALVAAGPASEILSPGRIAQVYAVAARRIDGVLVLDGPTPG